MKVFRVILIIVLMIICFLFVCLQTFHQRQFVLSSKISLDVIRDNIAWYKNKLGCYPDHLVDIPNYAESIGLERWNIKENNKRFGLYAQDSCFEYISNSKGNNNIHMTLDNQGGFYYNNKIGEVRLNLTRPLKKYFFIYYHSNGDEVPATW